jgi:hypothetical protein
MGEGRCQRQLGHRRDVGLHPQRRRLDPARQQAGRHRRYRTVKLGQGLGLFKDRVRLEGKIEVESKPLTDIEAARQIAFLLHQAMNAPTPAGKP